MLGDAYGLMSSLSSEVILSAFILGRETWRLKIVPDVISLVLVESKPILWDTYFNVFRHANFLLKVNQARNYEMDRNQKLRHAIAGHLAHRIGCNGVRPHQLCQYPAHPGCSRYRCGCFTLVGSLVVDGLVRAISF